MAIDNEDWLKKLDRRARLEEFAKAAMQGLLSSGDHSHLPMADLAQVALRMAEAQLNALEAWEY